MKNTFGVMQTIKLDPFLVHRLDAPTSGILLATTCEKWAITLRESFANREISKTYHAVVKAHANSRTSYWRDLSSERKQEWYHEG